MGRWSRGGRTMEEVVAWRNELCRGCEGEEAVKRCGGFEDVEWRGRGGFGKRIYVVGGELESGTSVDGRRFYGAKTEESSKTALFRGESAAVPALLSGVLLLVSARGQWFAGLGETWMNDKGGWRHEEGVLRVQHGDHLIECRFGKMYGSNFHDGGCKAVTYKWLFWGVDEVSPHVLRYLQT